MDENENIIKEFLKKNKEFKIKKIKLNNNYKFFKKFLQEDGCIKIYQNKNTDGFFITKIVKEC